MSNAAKMKSKIELLLAKAEGTDNDHERDAYTAKAQRLMLEWGIAEADLESRGEVKPETVVQVVREFRGQYSMAMGPFAHRVALGMGNVKTIKAGKAARWWVYAVGHQTDVDNFWMMMDSLERQALAALKVWWSTTPDRQWLDTSTEQWKARRQFILSFGATVGQRLDALREEVQEDATPGAALVLVSKIERVQSEYENLHPEAKASRGLSGGAAGHKAGTEAGRRAHLGGKAVGTGTAGALR